jgi:peptide/nickel transport system substrate-binding protein
MSKALKSMLIAGAAALTVGSMPAVAQQTNALTILRVIDADRYDPIRSTAAAEIVYMLADTLVSIDFDMQTIKPLLAKSWEVSEDGKTYTFKLREDVKFCDGRPMKAEDVVFSLKRWTDPASKSPVSFRGGPVKDIKATDDYTVVYELKEPYADLLFQLGLSFASVVDKASVEKLGENFGVQGFNATGPYCWVSWTPRQDFVMKKNPHYTWGPEIYKDPKPQVEQIVWRVIPEQNTLMAAMQAKQADATYYMPYIAIDTISRVPGMKVQQQKNYIYDAFMGFKVDKPVVKDEAIRRAVNMATNKDAIAKAVYFGKGAPMQSLLNPTVLDFDPKSASMMPKFARRMARRRRSPSTGCEMPSIHASPRPCRRICARSAST